MTTTAICRLHYRVPRAWAVALQGGAVLLLLARPASAQVTGELPSADDPNKEALMGPSTANTVNTANTANEQPEQPPPPTAAQPIGTEALVKQPPPATTAVPVQPAQPVTTVTAPPTGTADPNAPALAPSKVATLPAQADLTLTVVPRLVRPDQTVRFTVTSSDPNELARNPIALVIKQNGKNVGQPRRLDRSGTYSTKLGPGSYEAQALGRANVTTTLTAAMASSGRRTSNSVSVNVVDLRLAAPARVTAGDSFPLRASLGNGAPKMPVVFRFALGNEVQATVTADDKYAASHSLTSAGNYLVYAIARGADGKEQLESAPHRLNVAARAVPAEPKPEDKVEPEATKPTVVEPPPPPKNVVVRIAAEPRMFDVGQSTTLRATGDAGSEKLSQFTFVVHDLASGSVQRLAADGGGKLVLQLPEGRYEVHAEAQYTDEVQRSVPLMLTVMPASPPWLPIVATALSLIALGGAVRYLRGRPSTNKPPQEDADVAPPTPRLTAATRVTHDQTFLTPPRLRFRISARAIPDPGRQHIAPPSTPAPKLEDAHGRRADRP